MWTPVCVREAFATEKEPDKMLHLGLTSSCEVLLCTLVTDVMPPNNRPQTISHQRQKKSVIWNPNAGNPPLLTATLVAPQHREAITRESTASTFSFCCGLSHKSQLRSRLGEPRCWAGQKLVGRERDLTAPAHTLTHSHSAGQPAQEAVGRGEPTTLRTAVWQAVPSTPTAQPSTAQRTAKPTCLLLYARRHYLENNIQTPATIKSLPWSLLSIICIKMSITKKH